MRSSNPAPLALSDYDISPDQGFLPSDPLEQLPDSPMLRKKQGRSEFLDAR